MMRILFALLLFTPAGLTIQDFEKLHQEVRPPSDQLWRTIPWSVSLLEARERAEREGKPVFMWSMDGHPLGCT